MRTSFAIFGLILETVTATTGAHADDTCYKKAQSQAELTDCSVADLRRVDDHLNQLYKEMEGRLKGDDETKRLLVDAQEKWVAFRDAECTFLVVRTAGGSINVMNFNACVSGLTQTRIKDFQTYLYCSKKSNGDNGDCAIPGKS